MRVIVADDTAILREGLVRVLRDEGFDVVGDAADEAGLLAVVAAARPDVAIVDIRMPPTNTDEGIRAAAAIRSSHPDTAVLVLSQYAEADYAVRLLDAGRRSVGYLLKDRVGDIDVLTDAIRRVAAGEAVIDPEVVDRLVTRQRRADPVDDLTARERAVLGQMAEGRSNRGIASSLHMSLKTVETHVGSILSKLGLEGSPDDHRRVLAVLTWLRH